MFLVNVASHEFHVFNLKGKNKCWMWICDMDLKSIYRFYISS